MKHLIMFFPWFPSRFLLWLSRLWAALCLILYILRLLKPRMVFLSFCLFIVFCLSYLMIFVCWRDGAKCQVSSVVECLGPPRLLPFLTCFCHPHISCKVEVRLTIGFSQTFLSPTTRSLSGLCTSSQFRWVVVVRWWLCTSFGLGAVSFLPRAGNLLMIVQGCSSTWASCLPIAFHLMILASIESVYLNCNKMWFPNSIFTVLLIKAGWIAA